MVDLPAPLGPEMTMGVWDFIASVDVGAIFEDVEVKRRVGESLGWEKGLDLYTRSRAADEMTRGVV
jgi:hypothetical protein